MAWWELSCMVAVQKKKKIKEMFIFIIFFSILHNCLFNSTKYKDPKFRKHTEFFFFNGVVILIQIEKPLANAHVQTETSLENKETTTSLKQTLTFLTVVTTRTQTHMILGDYSLPPWYYGLWSSWAQ